MLFKRVESEGIAHYSYLVGDKNEAVVIDPRRDCDVYVKMSEKQGMSIRYILETHRHEDFIVGSVELSAKTGADILHADGHLEYGYGKILAEGKRISVGRLGIEAIDTPGHTLGSKSYVLYGPEGETWAVFSGDALFAGDVGRTDFMGRDRLEEMSGLLYESIQKIIGHDDGTLLCPAHGAGSVCGDSIADRVWTTIGLERKLNPKLKHGGKERFVSATAKMLDYPPYFRMMEERNLVGTPRLTEMPSPRSMSPKEFKYASKDSIILDARTELGFGSAHVPGSISIWADGIPSFGGWFLPYDRDILLVADGMEVQKTIRYLARMGYDNIKGYLVKAMLSWHMAGNASEGIITKTVQDLCKSIDNGSEDAWILDVRGDEEIAREGKLPYSHHIHITDLPERKNEVPKDREVHIFCGSGLRSMTAASLLKREGWKDLVVMLGGITSWNSLTCPLEED
ncbi:MAG: MBL fold metallo-hydrolase [Candidatus Methanofastidiosa archaeon]|nr:MBL fold metallo-hydrolase [Candidatus Methanofastidiosa archaeon]